MKEKSEECIVVTYQRFLMIGCFLTGFVSYVAGQENCTSPVIGKIGSPLKVPCVFEAYYQITWYNGRIEESTYPLIYERDNNTKGEGYDSGRYDILPDGSLLIKSLSVADEGIFTVKYYRTSDFSSVVTSVSVEVFVPPVPNFPVVNYSILPHVPLQVDPSVKLCCSVRGIYPRINLTMITINGSSLLSLRESNHSYNIHPDGKFDIVYTNQYQVQDAIPNHEYTITLQCKSADEIYEKFLEPTTVELLLPFAQATPVPVVDGCYSQQNHCVLQAKRTGDITCTVEQLDQNHHLRYELQDNNRSEKFVFNEQHPASNSVVASYVVQDETLGSVKLSCMLYNGNVQVSTAVVTLHFSEKRTSSLDGSDVTLKFQIETLRRLAVTSVILLSILIVVVLIWACLVLLMLTRNQKSKKQDTDYGKSWNSSDSGNSGSISGERSGSEASEKHQLSGYPSAV
ncbi:hypothetical protein HOLleu_04136 [Holothuria leucospilota]|uniref:Immunoglobulin domain-containing protein n=1 Tax=Holothuria leucospilota TaxID=206669 RepID=A0A9Q1CTP5_HOLLE|nr:hypothetical protein HOLleu_04136 [Holothuria leucospilota]